MMRILELLFGGKQKVSIPVAVGTIKVEPQRQKIVQKIREIDRSYEKINKEAKKMKRKIDTALVLAMTTGGLKEKEEDSHDR